MNGAVYDGGSLTRLGTDVSRPISAGVSVIALSVIVPFYNVEAYAADALRGLFENVRDDFEFLLVDDCSTDGTSQVLAEWEGRLPCARVIRHSANQGPSAARNTGIDVARGRYLTFLDGDDWPTPGYYSELIAAAEKFSCDFLRTDHVQVNGQERTVVRAPEARRGRVLDPRTSILPAESPTMVDYPYPWAGIYHHRLVEQGLLHFPVHLRTAEDRPWIWRLHRTAKSYAVLSLSGVRYRRGVATSLTQIGDARQLAFLEAFRQVFDELTDDPDRELLKPKAVWGFCAVIGYYLGRIDRFEPSVGVQLRARSAAALRKLPQDEVRRAMDGLEPYLARPLHGLQMG